jgi:hypothetical protein
MQNITGKLDEYLIDCREMERLHRVEYETLRDEFETLRDNARTFARRTEDLLKNLKGATAASHNRLDAITAHQGRAIESAYAVQKLMLRVHTNSLSVDDYYTVANEVFRGAISAMISKVDRDDPRLVAFKRDVDAMFAQWERVAPVPGKSRAWATEILAGVNPDGKTERTRDTAEAPVASSSVARE